MSPSLYFTKRLIRFNILGIIVLNHTTYYRHTEPAGPNEYAHQVSSQQVQRVSGSSAKSFMALTQTDRETDRQTFFFIYMKKIEGLLGRLHIRNRNTRSDAKTMRYFISFSQIQYMSLLMSLRHQLKSEWV